MQRRERVLAWKNIGWKNIGWKKKSASIAGLLLALYTLVGFLAIPLIAESILPDKLNQYLNRPAAVENISLNPYTLTLSIEELEIKEKAGEKTFVAFDRFFVNLQWSSLFNLALISKAVELENPRIRIARVSETEFNFSDLIASEQEKEAPAPEAEEPSDEEQAPFRFSLSNIKLSGGRFIFRDEPMDKTHSFSDIHFTLPVLSNFESDINTYAKPELAGDFNNTQLQVTASTKPFADSLQTVLNVSLNGISLPLYFDYVPVPLGFSVEKGSLDLQYKIAFSQDPEGGSRLEVSGTTDFSDLRLVDPGSTELLSIPGIHIEMAPSEPLNKHIRIKTLTLTEPSVTLLRSSSGELNLADLGPSAADAAEKKKTSEAKQKTQPEETDSEKEKPAPSDEASPFIFELARFQLDSGKIRFRDYAAPSASKGPQAGPVEIALKAINLTVSDFSNQAGEKADLDLSARLEPDAQISAAGSFGISPLAADLDLELSHLDLTRAQSYFPDALNLVLSDGRLDLSGKARLTSEPDSGLSANFIGRTGISEFLLVEKKGGRDLTRWQSLDLNGLDVSWNPTRVKLDELALNGLRQNVVVEKDGGLNLTRVYEKETAAGAKEQDKAPPEKTEKTKKQAESPAEAAGDEGGAPFPMSVDLVKISDLAVSFTDKSIDPHYASRLTLDEGRIKGLSTKAFEGANVTIKGAVDEHAPLRVAGKLNPLLEDLLLDIRFDLQNLAMPSLSPYSGKYIGRAIEKGKLNLNLDYRIKDKKLEAQNEVLLDQFSLGGQVESETAVNLPVGLAVALLKDRKGKIDLELPVSGRLDDPQFSLAGIILQTLKNIITKAATSPFSLVSSLVPGGEELRYIEFEAGQAELTDTDREKLKSMQKLLYERPELNLELTGYVDARKDRQALTEMLLEEKIRAAKRADKQKKKDEEAADPESISLTSKEYEKYLRRIYKAEVLAGPGAPEDAKPLSDKSLTAPEMKEKIRQQIEITDARLRLLAKERMRAVKNFILQDERIAPKRLFVRQAASLSPPEPGKFKSSRVELNLR